MGLIMLLSAAGAIALANKMAMLCEKGGII